MAITRIGQYPFEMNYPQSPAQNDRGLYKMDGDLRVFGEGSTNPYTGARSLQASSRQDTGIGFPIPSGADDIRGGFFYTSDHQWEEEHFMLKMYEADNAIPLLSVSFVESTSTINLEINGAIVQQATSVEFLHFFDERRLIYTHNGFHAIGGSRFVYYIDGVAALDYTNIAVPSGYDSVWHFTAGGTGWGSLYVDDMYLETVPGEAMAVPPSYRYLNSVADANGGVLDWAQYPNSGNEFEKVDDSGVDDDDTYVIALSTNSIEMFNTTDLTLPIQHTIVSAIPWALVMK